VLSWQFLVMRSRILRLGALKGVMNSDPVLVGIGGL
jgi:hypothetical protein